MSQEAASCHRSCRERAAVPDHAAATLVGLAVRGLLRSRAAGG